MQSVRDHLIMWWQRMGEKKNKQVKSKNWRGYKETARNELAQIVPI